jgi:cell wall-associated NlpC family hydrolase
VTKLSLQQVAQYAKQAGFTGDALTIAVAVSCAENGSHDTVELGDLNLETAKWGPSVGLWQIRSLIADYGTGRTRDEAHLTDPLFNARSAYSISSGGRDWSPWSTYKSGAYKQFLSDAADAAGTSTVGTAANATATSTAGGTSIAAASQGGTAVPITIGGKSLTGELGRAVIGGTVDLSTSQVSEVSLTLLDPGFALCSRYRLDLDSVLHCLNLPFRVVQLGSGSTPGGATVTLKAHPSGAVTMRTGTPVAASNISPTDYMKNVATAAGLRFWGRPSGKRSTVGPNSITDDLGNSRPETAWEIGDRLAGELGYYAFEAAGTYYFAPADYIKLNSTRVQLVAPGIKAYPETNTGKAYPAMELPTCDATISKNLTALQKKLGRTSILSCDVNINARIEREAGEPLRPGMTAWLPGTHPKFAKDGFLITRVSWDLVNPNSPVNVQAGTLATKTGTAATSADTDVSNDVPGLFGGFNTKSALDFVTIALRQVGDKYVYGVEDSPTDRDPSAFDCSELVQWAASQVGVTFVDGSSNQLAAIRKAKTTLTVDQAAKTRGALIFHPGHVVISLGDGQHTVEAMGRKYGVVQGSLKGRNWTAAGKIPGLVYP